ATLETWIATVLAWTIAALTVWTVTRILRTFFDTLLRRPKRWFALYVMAAGAGVVAGAGILYMLSVSLSMLDNAPDRPTNGVLLLSAITGAILSLALGIIIGATEKPEPETQESISLSARRLPVRYLARFLRGHFLRGQCLRVRVLVIDPSAELRWTLDHGFGDDEEPGHRSSGHRLEPFRRIRPRNGAVVAELHDDLVLEGAGEHLSVQEEGGIAEHGSLLHGRVGRLRFLEFRDEVGRRFLPGHAVDYSRGCA